MFQFKRFTLLRMSGSVFALLLSLSLFSQTSLIAQPCSGAFVDHEIPAGVMNGSNLVFTLSASPNPASSLVVFRNGLSLHPGLDYLLTGNSISFMATSAPQSGDILKAQFRTGCIGAPAHSLLSTLHSDTTPAVVSRGSIIVGQGTSAAWAALPLGATGRCLVSNGADAQWGNCLFTNFSNRAVPFSDAAGSLTQDSANFNFDTDSKRLGIGTATPSTSLHLFDARPSVGVTGLTVQAGTAQGSTPLTRWLNHSGTELGRLDSDGGLVVQRLGTTTTSTRAAWRDLGANVDPTGRLNGDFWFNSSQQARKSMEAGQTHPLPQVLCSSSGGSTSSTAMTVLGSCSVPASFLDSGDRLVVYFNASHTGTASAFAMELRMAGTVIYTRSLPNTELRLAFNGSAGLFGNGAAWQIQTFGATATADLKAFELTINPTSSFTIDFRGRLTSSSSDSLAIRNYSIVRYPAQYNP